MRRLWRRSLQSSKRQSRRRTLRRRERRLRRRCNRPPPLWGKGDAFGTSLHAEGRDVGSLAQFFWGVNANSRGCTDRNVAFCPISLPPYSYQRVEGALPCHAQVLREANKSLFKWWSPTFCFPHSQGPLDTVVHTIQLWYRLHSIRRYLARQTQRHLAAITIQCWKRRIWLNRRFAAQAQLRQKRLGLRILCRGASAHAVLVRGHRTCPTPKPTNPLTQRLPDTLSGIVASHNRCRNGVNETAVVGNAVVAAARVKGFRPQLQRPLERGHCVCPQLIGLHRKLWQLSSTVLGRRVQNLPSRLPQQSNMLSASTRKFGGASCLRDYRRQHSACTSMLPTPSCVSSVCKSRLCLPLCILSTMARKSMLDGEGQETRFSSLWDPI